MEEFAGFRRVANFKSVILFLLFIIISYYTYEAVKIPYRDTIPNFSLLLIAVLLTAYLNIQSLRDRHLLQKSYEKLDALQEQVKKSNLEATLSLALAEEAKDSYTRGHSARVAEYSLTIARKVGFSERELTELENASILHDIGKIGIGDAILRKKGKLNKEEWKIIKKHSYMALDILAPLKFLDREKNILKHHHERYDGKGYPEGLSGDEIPLGSRIIAVADAYDAMRSKRPYREALTEEKARLELKENSGTQFDPRIVNIFLELLSK